MNVKIDSEIVSRGDQQWEFQQNQENRLVKQDFAIAEGDRNRKMETGG